MVDVVGVGRIDLHEPAVVGVGAVPGEPARELRRAVALASTVGRVEIERADGDAVVVRDGERAVDVVPGSRGRQLSVRSESPDAAVAAEYDLGRGPGADDRKGVVVVVGPVRERHQVVPRKPGIEGLPDVRAASPAHVQRVQIRRNQRGVVPAAARVRGAQVILHRQRDGKQTPGLTAIGSRLEEAEATVVGTAPAADGERRRSPNGGVRPEEIRPDLRRDRGAAVSRELIQVGEASAVERAGRELPAIAVVRHGRVRGGRARVALIPDRPVRERTLSAEHARVVAAVLIRGRERCRLRREVSAILLHQSGVEHRHRLRRETVRLRRVGIEVHQREIGPRHVVLRELDPVIVVGSGRVGRQHVERSLTDSRSPVRRSGRREVEPTRAVVTPHAGRTRRRRIHLEVAGSRVNGQRKQRAARQQEGRLNDDLGNGLPVERIRSTRPAQQRPGATRIVGLVHARAGVGVRGRAVVAVRVVDLARAVEDVRRIIRIDRDGSAAKRCGRRAEIEQRQPGVPAVLGLPRAAASRRDVNHVRIGRIDRRSRHAAGHG